ncbi:hypothetical protein K474DRAFT_1748055 [Panus rudis PR-1116 ss-1]|nr:hypothetical protein K474DRAFT_1748055 [Panus rudis PR-1116 ss-1]
MECLPSYSPSTSAPPKYSPDPQEDERRLDLTVRTQRRATPEGTFIRSCSGITVVFEEQDVGVTAPTFPRNAIVKGEVLLEGENVYSVKMKLMGEMTMTIPEGGTSQTQLFTESKTLWQRPTDQPCAQCPSIVPFRLPFPHSYEDGSEIRTVPPTFTAHSPAVPGIFVRIAYTITITVTKLRFGGFKKRQTVNIPVFYHPRSRPYMPIGTGLYPFLSTVKCAPGDWHQVTSKMKARPGSSVGDVESHLFIPSVLIYGLSDTIPFHLQLQGSPAALHADLDPSLPWYTDARSDKPVVRVYYLRQILVKVNGQKAWRNVVLGEGKMCPVENQYHASPDAEQRGELALDWEGELRCESDATVGGFNIGALVVKDFIMVELKPASAETSSLLEHQNPIPIRLVTDTYSES